MPALTAAPSPSKSGGITTAPLRLLKKFHGTVLCLISLNDQSDRVLFDALAYSLCTRNSRDQQDTKA